MKSPTVVSDHLYKSCYFCVTKLTEYSSGLAWECIIYIVLYVIITNYHQATTIVPLPCALSTVVGKRRRIDVIVYLIHV